MLVLQGWQVIDYRHLLEIHLHTLSGPKWTQALYRYLEEEALRHLSIQLMLMQQSQNLL